MTYGKYVLVRLSLAFACALLFGVLTFGLGYLVSEMTDDGGAVGFTVFVGFFVWAGIATTFAELSTDAQIEYFRSRRERK